MRLKQAAVTKAHTPELLDTTLEMEQVELRKAFEVIERFRQTVEKLHHADPEKEVAT